MLQFQRASLPVKDDQTISLGHSLTVLHYQWKQLVNQVSGSRDEHIPSLIACGWPDKVMLQACTTSHRIVAGLWQALAGL